MNSPPADAGSRRPQVPLDRSRIVVLHVPAHRPSVTSVRLPELLLEVTLLGQNDAVVHDDEHDHEHPDAPEAVQDERQSDRKSVV